MRNGKACYVEIDHYAAAWLENLVARGVIAPGDVMCRSVTDIRPEELADYSQVHLYAGIGVHSYAMRRAGISDAANVWTFSEPCQPFSDAGKGLGFADQRYLRPFTNHLIEQCRPAICLGEQVASNDGLGWLDIVQSDFERARYACGAQDTCSAGVGAPHIRQRLRVCAVAEEWLADAAGNGRVGRWSGKTSYGRGSSRIEPQRLCNADWMANTNGEQCDRHRARGTRRWLEHSDGRGARILADSHSEPGRLSEHAGRSADFEAVRNGAIDVLVHPERAGLEGLGRHGNDGNQPGRLGAVPYRSIGTASGVGGMADAINGELSQPIGRAQRRNGNGSIGADDSDLPAGIGHNSLRRAGPTNGFWGDADWLFCKDGKWRPVEPGTFPLAHGAASRVGRLRAYGNAVDAEATTAFYKEVAEVLGLI